MKNMFLTFLNVLLLPTLINLNNANAQRANISGKLMGLEENEIIVISLHKASDSFFVKDTFTDEQSHYYFNDIPNDNYLISINQIGYKEYWSSRFSVLNSNVEVPDIILEKDIEGLGNVIVTTTRPFLQRKVDRLIVHPDALIGNTATNALDVLEKAPGVLVDVNGNISMKGKPGVIIFIDDKPTYLSATELAGFLKSIPGSSIDKLELMVNPPAHYDAAGNAGIINIKLKRNREKGINGSINLGYGQGRYSRTNNAANVNYRINKFNFFGSVGFNQNQSYQDLDINRYYYNADGSFNAAFLQNSYIKMDNGGRNMRLGLDYYATTNTTFGMAFSGFINPSESSINNNADILDDQSQKELLITSFSPSNQKWNNGSINLNFNHKLDQSGKELSVNADYINYNSTHFQELLNQSFLPSGIQQSNTLLISSLPASIDIFSAKVDYTQIIKGGRFDAGVKWSSVKTGNDALFYDKVGDITNPNYEFTNQFDYNEMISASYINYAKDWSKISFQIGLRLENTNAKGYQFGNPIRNDSTFKFQYTNAFPTIFVLYKLDTLQNNQITFSAGRRIDRPDYKDLNPFTFPIDRYTFYGGNPFLKPTFSYNLELSHIYKNIVTTTFEYSIANDLIQETNEQRGAIYYSRPGNFGKQGVWGFSLNATLPITKWWTLNLYSEAKNIAVNTIIYNQKIDENKWYWYFGPTNQFKINSKLSAELAGSYQTSILVGQFLTIPVWQMRAGIAYNFWQGNATMKLNVSDIFYSNQPGGDIRNIENSTANWLSHLDSRVVNIGLSYRFNKGKWMQARKSGASDTEKGRVKMG